MDEYTAGVFIDFQEGLQTFGAVSVTCPYIIYTKTL